MKLNRRDFATFGALGLAAGMLPPASVTAQTQGAQRRRLISIFTPMGQMPEWLPEQSADGITLSQQCASLEPFKDKLLYVTNTRSPLTLGTAGGTHTLGFMSNYAGMGHKKLPGQVLSSYEEPTIPSVDQLVSTHHSTTPLVLGASSSQRRSIISYLAPKAPGQLAPGVVPRTNPGQVFDSMFRDFGRSDQELVKLRKLRGSVLDAWSDQISALSQEISVESRPIMDAHLQQLRDLEVNLANSVSGCDPMAPPAGEANYPETIRRQMDNIVSAFACNMTSTATLSFHEAQSKIFHRWVTASNQEHHAMTHNAATPANHAALNSIYTWQVEQIAYLLGQLAAIPEPDGTGTMLDNTVLYWCSENGEHHTHHGYNMRALIVGHGHFQGNKYYQTGKVRLEQPSHNDILSELFMACTGEQTMVYDDPRMATRNEFPELRA